MNNKEFVRGALIGMSATLAGVILLQLVGEFPVLSREGMLSDTRFVNKLEYIEKLTEENFLGEIDEEKQAEGVYAGFLAALEDPYTYYYTAEAYEEENAFTEGSYVGIGITMQKNVEGGAKIVDVYKGSSAKEAGLEVGDLIVAVDSEDVMEKSNTEIAALIRGSGKEKVTLTIYKEEATEPVDVEVELKTIELPSVEYEMLEDGVGYLQIIQFTGIAADQYEAAFEDLQKQGMKKLVIDLRDNPGGRLDVVCEILEKILPEGLIVYTEDKYGRREEISCEGESPLELPFVVLVNGNSASASEIFAGAVKDYGIGTLVGTKTFGKGVVQALYHLDDGSGVKLTIANYFTPNGTNIHGVGIEPDVEVKLEESLLNRSEYSKEEDNQLQEAIRILNQVEER